MRTAGAGYDHGSSASSVPDTWSSSQCIRGLRAEDNGAGGVRMVTDLSYPKGET